MNDNIDLDGLCLLLDTPETRISATDTIIHHLLMTSDVATQISLLNLLQTQTHLPEQSLKLLESKQSRLRPGVRMYLRDLIRTHRPDREENTQTHQEHAILSVAFGPLPN